MYLCFIFQEQNWRKERKLFMIQTNVTKIPFLYSKIDFDEIAYSTWTSWYTYVLIYGDQPVGKVTSVRRAGVTTKSPVKKEPARGEC